MIRKCSLLFGCMIALILSLSLGHNAYATDRSTSLQESIRSLGPDYELPVIIYMSDKAVIGSMGDKDKRVRTAKVVRTLKDKATLTQASLRSFLELRNAEKMKSLWIINSIAAVVPVRLIPELEKFPGVESVEQDYTVHAPVVKYGIAALPESNLESIKAPEIWNLGDTGAGVVVASIDTGVDLNHPDLEGKWRGGSNSWYDPNGEHSSPYDADGHGTMTTGIMIGGSAGGTAIGVAPDAKWIAVKIFNDRGDSTTSNIHDGFQWLLDPDGNPETDDAPDVINASWGLVDSAGQCVLIFGQDIQNLRAAGIAVVFAAGNEGPPAPPLTNTSDSPANNSGSFAVGAVDNNNIIASFSSRGPSACDGSIFPHVVAPGVDIRTSDLTSGRTYSSVSGTSFAAPHVAGAMALLRSAFPGKTIEEIELSLEQSATDLGIPESDNAYGFGLINILKAYDILMANNTTSPKIGVLPLSDDFGRTAAGTSTLPASFSVTNKGSADLQIGSASLGGANADDFKISSDSCSGMTIGPQQSCAVEIYFSPSAPGVKHAVLSIPSNDPVTPALSVPLLGTGTSPRSLTVMSPNGSENWTTGTKQTIQWTYSGNPGPFVKIELLKGGVLNRTIKSRISAGKGSFTWTIPAKLTLGNDYRMRTRSTTNAAYSDTSNADFSIVSPPPPSITVTAPDGGEIWQRGSSQIIDWTYAGKAGTHVKIQLFRDGILNRTISLSAKIGNSGSGSFIWRIPATLTPGDTYQVKITSKSKGTVTDISNGTFTIE